VPRKPRQAQLPLPDPEAEREAQEKKRERLLLTRRIRSQYRELIALIIKRDRLVIARPPRSTAEIQVGINHVEQHLDRLESKLFWMGGAHGEHDD
jgi:hypothetical protein